MVMVECFRKWRDHYMRGGVSHSTDPHRKQITGAGIAPGHPPPPHKQTLIHNGPLSCGRLNHGGYVDTFQAELGDKSRLSRHVNISAAAAASGGRAALDCFLPLKAPVEGNPMSGLRIWRVLHSMFMCNWAKS